MNVKGPKGRIPTIAQGALFETDLDQLPSGLMYEQNFLSQEEEAHWLGLIQALPIEPMRYKQYTAKRRVISFGRRYDFDDNRLEATDGMPQAFEPLRQRAATWLGCRPEDLIHMLVAEYGPGTPLGWHRDVPNFEAIIGISLASEATMRLRPCPPASKRSKVVKLVLAPRSVYCLTGPARWAWQHSMAPTPALRYSVTFRTGRAD